MFDSVVNRATVERAGIFDFDEIQRLRNEHVSLKTKHSKVLFSILTFMLWQERMSKPAWSREQAPSRARLATATG
jgi:hypothetical protein